ncbi:MAG: hypothetical protein ACJ74Z_12055 [Bryobacteraceae bacterium]
MAGQWMSLPRCPSDSIKAKFNDDKKAVLSLSGKRTDFDQKHPNNAAIGDWKRTRAYLISVAYYAIKARCDEDEVLWYLVAFITQQCPAFFLTPKRFQTLLKLATGRLKSTRSASARRARPREHFTIRSGATKPEGGSTTRSSKRLRQVARLIEKNLGYKNIAKKLHIGVATARDYCRKVRKRGTDQVLRPKPKKKFLPSFECHLAEFIYELCRHAGYAIKPKTANATIRQITTYALQVKSCQCSE